MSLVLQFELILKIGSIICAYEGRQKNISRAPRWTGLIYAFIYNSVGIVYSMILCKLCANIAWNHELHDGYGACRETAAP
jgi:hypothetical protein